MFPFEILLDDIKTIEEIELEMRLRCGLILTVSMYDCVDNNIEDIPLIVLYIDVRIVEFRSEEWLKLLEKDEIISVSVMSNTELSLEIVINFDEPVLWVT